MFLPKNGFKVIVDTCVMALTLAQRKNFFFFFFYSSSSYSTTVEWCLLPSAGPNVQQHGLIFTCGVNNSATQRHEQRLKEEQAARR